MLAQFWINQYFGRPLQVLWCCVSLQPNAKTIILLIYITPIMFHTNSYWMLTVNNPWYLWGNGLTRTVSLIPDVLFGKRTMESTYRYLLHSQFMNLLWRRKNSSLQRNASCHIRYILDESLAHTSYQPHSQSGRIVGQSKDPMSIRRRLLFRRPPRFARGTLAATRTNEIPVACEFLLLEAVSVPCWSFLTVSFEDFFAQHLP